MSSTAILFNMILTWINLPPAPSCYLAKASEQIQRGHSLKGVKTMYICMLGIAI